MTVYHSRLVENRLQEVFQYFKVILLLGARQVGKSTLLQRLYPNYPYYVFDPVQDLFQVRSDPDLFLKSLQLPVILDEVQYVPELLPSIKRFVDQKQEKGQFLLTGSQNFAVKKNIKESLAGRVGILNLWGMTILEQYDQSKSLPWLRAWIEQDIDRLKNGKIIQNVDVHRAIWRGGFPGTIDFPEHMMADYFNSYLQTYIERDIRSLSDIDDLQLFSRFVQLRAALTAQEINHSKVSKELGVAMMTGQKWLGHLQNTYLWHEIPSFSRNAAKRITRRAKGYFADTGLACYLMRITSKETLLGHPQRGALFETLGVNDIVGMASVMREQPAFHHWRTNGGAEVDLILEINGTLFPIEFKCATSVSKNDLRGINAFSKDYGHIEKIAPGLVIYAGEYFRQISETAYALPWNWVCK